MAYYNGKKTKQLTNQFRLDNNKIMKEVLKTDYEKLMTFDGVKYFMNKKPLLSWSTSNKGLSEMIYYTIPKETMMLVQDEGKAIMYYLEMVANKEVKDLKQIDFMSEKVKKMFYALMQCFIDNELTLLAVEKHVANEYWHGYIDCIVRQANGLVSIVEIKTRSNYDVRKTDLMQLMVYNSIISSKNLSKLLIIVNRKTFGAEVFQINHRECKSYASKLNAWLEVLGLDKYKLAIKGEKNND